MAAKSEKAAVVENMAARLAKARGVYLTDFTGMNVATLQDLRRRMRKSEIHYEVVKNTLARRAVEASGLRDLEPHLEGPTAIAIVETDELAPARILGEFAKEFQRPRVKLAVVEGKVFTEEEVKALALLPSRDVLLAQLLGAMQGPMRNLVGVLSAPLRDFVSALDQIRRKKEGGGE
jgi:large subunit ribosomal protein L10